VIRVLTALSPAPSRLCRPASPTTMTDAKRPVFAPNSVAHRAAETLGEYLPRELSSLTGEYLRDHRMNALHCTERLAVPCFPEPSSFPAPLRVLLLGIRCVVHEWDTETEWKSPYVTVSADRKTATYRQRRPKTVCAVGRWTFGEGGAVRFSIRCLYEADVCVGLVRRSGAGIRAPDWKKKAMVPYRDALYVRLFTEDCVEAWDRSSVAESESFALTPPLVPGTTLTYTFTVDRARGTVDLLIDGQRVREKPLWSGLTDIDGFAPLMSAEWSKEMATAIELVPCRED
jgi:hypothetical protein